MQYSTLKYSYKLLLKNYFFSIELLLCNDNCPILPPTKAGKKVCGLVIDYCSRTI